MPLICSYLLSICSLVTLEKFVLIKKVYDGFNQSYRHLDYRSYKVWLARVREICSVIRGAATSIKLYWLIHFNLEFPLLFEFHLSNSQVKII